MIVTKKGSAKMEAKKTSNINERIQKNKWKKVKIKGHVIANDVTGFEGFIGLEVLKNYEPDMVDSTQIYEKHNPKKRKIEKSGESGDESEETQVDIIPNISKNKKARFAEHHAFKLQKLKQNRLKRKEQRKQNAVIKSAAVGKITAIADKENEEYPPGRFALIRPPPPSNIDRLFENAKVPQINLDDLEGWNRLGVPQTILCALAENGFKSPTEIQTMTLPAAIMGKKDILGAAETGSGKTLAFGIPILSGIMELKRRNTRTGIRRVPWSQKKSFESTDEYEQHGLKPSPEEFSVDSDDNDDVSNYDMGPSDPLYAIVLTPTRELAVQVTEHLASAAKYTGIKVAAIFGGLSVEKQERILRRRPEIIVATPGRLWELYQQGNKHLRKIQDISFLVIDETDRMVEKGHFEELKSLLKVLNADEQKKQTRQNFVFSATLTLVHDLPDNMQKRNVGRSPKFVKQTSGQKLQSLIDELGISQPKIVDITSKQQTAQNLTECRLICPIDHKDYYLYYFVQRHPGRTIVFCNSIDCVKRLATLFSLLDCNPLPLHANMIQKQRLKNLERFRDNPFGLLIATDVAARGLDIPNVEHVIHYQVPRTGENYVHRSGRTARANKDGITVMFMEPREVKCYVKLYKTLGRTEVLPLFPIAQRYLDAVKRRVNLARDLDKEELKLRRSQANLGWIKKHAKEMEIIIDDFNNESGSDRDEDLYVIERRRNRLRVESVRMELRNLLAKPMFPKGFNFKYPTSTGQLPVTELATITNSSAVETMKATIENLKMAKKLRNKKRK